MKQQALLLIGLLVLAVTARAVKAVDPANTPKAFEAANAAFAAGDFAGAIRENETMVRAGEWSAPLFYNLGNAYFRTGDLGHAVLAYERALRLAPEHPETQANLRLARQQSGALELPSPPLARYFRFTTPAAYAVAAAVLFWLGVLLLLMPTRRSSVVAAVVCLLLCGISVLASYTLLSNTTGQAIVLGKEVQARVATADTAKGILALPPGSEIVVLETRGEWSYVLLPNQERGWVTSEAVERIQPHPPARDGA